MSALDPRPGAAPLADLRSLPEWEAALIRDMRRWPAGARCADQTRFMRAVQSAALRPLVRHPAHCTTVGADECVLLHLVRTASAGDLGDAAMIAALIARPCEAEHLALLAGAAGSAARQRATPRPGPFPAQVARRLI